MGMNLHLAHVFVISVAVLQATGSSITSAPQVLDATAHPEAYAIYATELPKLWAQEKDTLLLQQETGGPHSDPCGILKKQTGDWADAAQDFLEQNARVWMLQPALPKIQYRLIRRDEIEAQDARLPGTYPGRPGVAQYAVVSAIGFSHDRTKAVVYVHLRLHGWLSKLELKDGKWQSVGEGCTVSA
jgi:hypothetical protein